jgi:peptidoglycan/xylan/chitin deacetylase (PgdA/CDA1 family)
MVPAGILPANSDPGFQSNLLFPEDHWLYRQKHSTTHRLKRNRHILPTHRKNMGVRLKQAFLHISKWLGLFHLAGLATRGGLRILCYHGFALDGESAFRSSLFMEADVFRRRLDFLRRNGFPVLGLSEALGAMDCRRLPPRATVITIDDGFYSVHKLAKSLLAQYGFPATVYITSYYCLKETPIFRLVVQYMFWKTNRETIELGELVDTLSSRFLLSDPRQREDAIWTVIRYGEEQCNEPQRVALCERLGHLLEVDYEWLRRSRALSLMNTAELEELSAAGFDIQLHTHRHRFPEEEPLAMQEIRENRASLAPFAKDPLVHFCYPSGIWSDKQWAWLAAQQIASATTCLPGLNYSSTPRLALTRILDGQNIPQIEFEAELWGYKELLRKAKSTLGWLADGWR